MNLSIYSVICFFSFTKIRQLNVKMRKSFFNKNKSSVIVSKEYHPVQPVDFNLEKKSRSGSIV